MGRKNERDVALEAIIGKAEKHIDGRYRGRRLIEILAEKYPQPMKLEIRRLLARLDEASVKGLIDEDLIMLMQLEVETSALRTVLGWRLAELPSLLREDGKVNSMMNPFLQMTRILLQIINIRRRGMSGEEGESEDESPISVRKLLAEMVKREDKS